MVFVTGGTGLVGSHLLLSLLQNGEKVRALKRSTSNISQVQKVFSWYTSEAEKLFRRIEWVNGDILDIYSLESLLEGIDTVYHCAAIVSFDSRTRKQMLANNIEGTANLVNASLNMGVKRICHVSSVSALGKTSNGEPINEATNWIPSKRNTGYSESKFFSETEIWRGVEEGLEAVIVNPSIIIGPGRWKEGSPAFFRVMYQGLPFYTLGSTGYIGINDVVKAIEILMNPENFVKAKNQRFLLNSENLTFREFFTQVSVALGKPAPRIPISRAMLSVAWRILAIWTWISGKPSPVTRETASSSSSHTTFDGSKISRMFSFQYRPVDEAIRSTAGIFIRDLQHGDQLEPAQNQA